MRNDNQSKETLEKDLLELVAEEGMVDRADLTREAALADLDIASADFIMILMAIEETYGVYISVDNEMSGVTTVQDLLSVASRKILEKSDA